MSRRDNDSRTYRTTTNLVDIDAELLRETAAAYQIGYGDVIVWVPKSLVEYDERSSTFTMPEWLAIDKELI